MSDEHNNEYLDLDAANEEQIKQFYHVVLESCNGTDEEGLPNSAISIGIFEMENDEEGSQEKEKAMTTFGGSVNRIIASDHCAIVQADFPRESAFEFKRAKDITAEWLENKDNPEYQNCYFVLVIVPMLASDVQMVHFDLVYVDSYQLDESTHRMILCFDTIHSQMYTTEDIDVAAIIEVATAELDREEQEADEEYNAVIDETEQWRREQMEKEENFTGDTYNPMDIIPEPTPDEGEGNDSETEDEIDPNSPKYRLGGK